VGANENLKSAVFMRSSVISPGSQHAISFEEVATEDPVQI
jgi:hypothetical protein